METNTIADALATLAANAAISPCQRLGHQEDPSRLHRPDPQVPFRPLTNQPETATMQTKHTPGPWTLCPSTHSGLAISNAEDGEFKVPRAALALCGKSRTTVNGWHYIAAMNDHQQAQADARLIAAAPELLVALRALLEDAIELGIYEGNMSGSAVAARNAIDKATGGAA